MRETIEFIIAQSLQIAIFVVLIFTCRAAFKQAEAANKLTEATNKQIKATEDQAKAASEQVEVARRQITESLRPILIARSGGIMGGNNHVKIKNEGAGVALNVWWDYGKPSRRANTPYSPKDIDVGIIPPNTEYTIEVDERKRSAEGLTIIYHSLSGILSATMIDRESAGCKNVYVPEVDWELKKLHNVELST